MNPSFPHASQDFKKVNPGIFLRAGANSNVQSIVERAQPYSERMLKNKTESEYAQILESMKTRGEILRWEYQGITLRWFDMKYTPDFVVFWELGDVAKMPRISMIEVKGPHIHYRQQAVARFKGARGFWPEFQFEMHQKTKEGWKRIY